MLIRSGGGGGGVWIPWVFNVNIVNSKIQTFHVGEFGDVYKGELTKPNEGKIEVAVKTLKVILKTIKITFLIDITYAVMLYAEG